MTAVAQLHKPLRNHIRKVNLEESLGVIRAYVQNLQFNEPLPADIRVAPQFLTLPWASKPIHEWDFEVIAQETILHATDLPGEKTLRDWPYLAGAYNKLRDLEGDIWREYRNDVKPSAAYEFFRMAHRQFPWQRRASRVRLTRYFKLFSHPLVEPVVSRIFGIASREIYATGLALAGVYLTKLGLHYPPRIEIEGISGDILDHFLRRFSCPIDALRDEVRDAQRFDERFLYGYNPLRAHPLIRMPLLGRDSLVCPLPPLLINRFTDGVYYEVCSEADFGSAFGVSFQQYVGEVLLVITRDAGHMRVLPEQEYHVGKQRKDTVDWRVADRGSILFIECKTKRLRLGAKMDIIARDVLDEDLESLADAVVQVYRSIDDYQKGRYPDTGISVEGPPHPLVVTLEEWHVFGPLFDQIDTTVRQRLRESELDEEMLRTMPYSVCSIDELEQMIHVMVRHGIDHFMRKKLFEADHRLWEFGPYMTNHFSEDLQATNRELFPEDARRIHPVIL